MASQGRPPKPTAWRVPPTPNWSSGMVATEARYVRTREVAALLDQGWSVAAYMPLRTSVENWLLTRPVPRWRLALEAARRAWRWLARWLWRWRWNRAMRRMQSDERR